MAKKNDVKSAMLQEQEKALTETDVVVADSIQTADQLVNTARTAEEQAADFDRLMRGDGGQDKDNDLATTMAKEAGEIPQEDEKEEELEPVIFPEDVRDDREESEVLHSLIGKPVEDMPGFYWPVKGDQTEKGSRHSPDGVGMYWLDKVLVKVNGKEELVWRFDKAASKPVGED